MRKVGGTTVMILFLLTRHRQEASSRLKLPHDPVTAQRFGLAQRLAATFAGTQSTHMAEF